jgi:hypothetical protein
LFGGKREPDLELEVREAIPRVHGAEEVVPVSKETI